LVHLADLFAKERGIGMGLDDSHPEIVTSFAWILIQEQHTPFIEVNVDDFIQSFNNELDRRWVEMTTLLSV
jgi:hypothetical protein